MIHGSHEDRAQVYGCRRFGQVRAVFFFGLAFGALVVAALSCGTSVEAVKDGGAGGGGATGLGSGGAQATGAGGRWTQCSAPSGLAVCGGPNACPSSLDCGGCLPLGSGRLGVCPNAAL